MGIKLGWGAAVLVCAISTQAFGQDAYSYTFTSGPYGDGFDWPRSQRSSQWPGGGLSGGPFFPGDDSQFSFYNFSGNPAYFDSSNLLTRPAALINNDAWWTDPRIATYTYDGKTFESASLSFGWQPGTTPFSFGFDLAVASVSHPVPIELGFHAQDTENESVFGTISLAPDGDGDGGGDAQSLFIVEIDGVTSSMHGTFSSLGSPYQGREARFYFDVETLLAPIRPDDPAPEYGISLFTIDLDPLVTLGGTTQLAIDNFIINDGTPAAPSREPVYYNASHPVARHDDLSLHVCRR